MKLKIPKKGGQNENRTITTRQFDATIAGTPDYAQKMLKDKTKFTKI